MQLEAPIWVERRTAGQFDIDFSATNQDPSPTGLSQGWSCAGRTNVARFCDPVVDSLIDAASRTADGAQAAWHAVLRRIEADAPAAFFYAPSYLYVVNRRFTDVTDPARVGVAGAARVDRGWAGRAPRGLLRWGAGCSGARPRRPSHWWWP